MAALLVVFIAARAAIATLARPHFRPPITADPPLGAGADDNTAAGNWLLSEQVRTADGRTRLHDGWLACDTSATCASDAHSWVSYLPADRFWPFQYTEAGVVLALAALLLWLAAPRAGPAGTEAAAVLALAALLLRLASTRLRRVARPCSAPLVPHPPVLPGRAQNGAGPRPDSDIRICVASRRRVPVTWTCPIWS